MSNGKSERKETPVFSSRLIVTVRIRPLNELEKVQTQAFQCVHQIDEQHISLLDPEKLENNVLRQNRQFKREFTFDSAFGPDSTHDEVHRKITAPLVDYVVAGYNGTVFAYGPTGTGKTYTMMGTPETPGLMTLLMKALYEKNNANNEFTVYISFLEIYNELIRDLLNPAAGVLDLLEDETGSVRVPGLSWVKALNTDKMMEILQEGNQHRTQEPTAANKYSSRSHALLQVTIYRKSHQHGKLFLIDLAGSERVSHTQNRGQRLKESAAINRSLLALGNVINALSVGGRRRYVNYRDSKLTRLLKDSLGSNSMTCMIAHVAPSSTHYDETYNTLIYANRAKNISNELIRSKRPSSANNRRTTSIIDQIRNETGRENSVTGPHASSAVQLTSTSAGDKKVSATVRDIQPAVNRHSNAPNRMRNDNIYQPAGYLGQRQFSSLFNSLKEQYLASCEKQQRFREQLLKANYDAFEADLSRVSKIAIRDAWNKHIEIDVSVVDEKYSHVIKRIQKDSDEQEKRCTQLQNVRHKLERILRQGGDTLHTLEDRMRSLVRDSQQRDLVNLLVRMAIQDAESMAAMSDSVLQSVRLRWQENSLLRIRKYEQIADRLISSDQISKKDRETLKQEYHMVRNQLNYHLIPLRQANTFSVVSWNTQLLRDFMRASNFPAKSQHSPAQRSIVGMKESDNSLFGLTLPYKRLLDSACTKDDTNLKRIDVSQHALPPIITNRTRSHKTCHETIITDSPSNNTELQQHQQRRISNSTIALSPLHNISCTPNDASSSDETFRAFAKSHRLPTINTQAPTSTDSASFASDNPSESIDRIERLPIIKAAF